MHTYVPPLWNAGFRWVWEKRGDYTAGAASGVGWRVVIRKFGTLGGR